MDYQPGAESTTVDKRGKCVAAIVEGPESKLPEEVKVKAYPAVERFGIAFRDRRRLP